MSFTPFNAASPGRFARGCSPVLLLAASFFLTACGPAWKSGDGGRDGITSSLDLGGKRIGVMLGSTQDAYATKHFPQAEIVRFNASPDTATALKAGQVDAVFEDAVFAKVILKKEKGLVVLEKGLTTETMGVGFRKGEQRLMEAFNAFLKGLKACGLYQEIYDRWIQEPESASMPDLPPAGTAGELTLGTSNLGLPFATIKDGRFAGFDIEIMERFARSLNMGLSIQDITFSGLISALASGKVDIIASCITVTEERKKQVDFSDPYFESGTLILVRADSLANSKPRTEAEGGGFFRTVADSFYNNIVFEGRYLLILAGLRATVLISIFAMLFGTLLGAVVCYMRMSRNPLLSIPAKVYISVLRGTPVLILLMLMFYVVFASLNLDPLVAAVFTFGLNFAAYVSEMFRAAVGSVDRGQTEAGVALGFTRFRAFLYIVLPQAARQVLPVYKGEFISMVKMTSVVGYIAVQDLTKVSDIIRSRTFDAFFPLVMVGVLYYAIAYILTLFLTALEKMLDRRPSGKRVRAI